MSPSDRTSVGDPGEAARDEQLMRGIAAGDRAAYGAFVERHLTRTLAVAQRIVGGRADAEDIAQETFLRVWRAAPRWRAGEARVTTWLYRVTVNLCLDLKRRPLHDDIETAGDIADPADDAVAVLGRAETARAVARAIETLPARQRTAVALCHSTGLSNAEAAAVMAISVSAIEALLVRARRRLRELLAGSLG